MATEILSTGRKSEQKGAEDSSDAAPKKKAKGIKTNYKRKDLNGDSFNGNCVINESVSKARIRNELTMERSIQDGGSAHMMNSMDQGQYHNSGHQAGYLQGSGDTTINSQDYGKMNDTGQMHNSYNGGYNRSYYDQANMNEVPSNSQPSNMFNQYGQQSYNKGMLSGSRSGIGIQGMPMNNYPGQPRMLSGQSISQQAGPTPTLNQLLQSPNPATRYQNSYSDYGRNQLPPGGQIDGANMQYGSPSQSWARGPYHQQSSGTRMPGYSQQGGLNDPSQGKSPYMGPGPGYPAQHSSQYGAYSQQQRSGYMPPGPPSSRSQPFSQQQGMSQYSEHGRGQMGYQSPYQGQMSGAAGGGVQPPPSSQPGEQTQGQSQVTNRSPGESNSNDIQSDDSGRASVGSQGGSTAMHPSVSALRTAPSPVGSTSSRSMSPANTTGPNIPMPPRPPSSVDSPQSSMPNQGYNHQIMSPQMSNQSAYSSGKVPPPSSLSSQMNQYGGPGSQSQQSQYGAYNRGGPQGSLGGPGYGGQPANYPSSQPGHYSSSGMNSMPPYGANYRGAPPPSERYGQQYGMPPMGLGGPGIRQEMPANMSPNVNSLPSGGAQAAAMEAIKAAAAEKSHPVSQRSYLQSQQQRGMFAGGKFNSGGMSPPPPSMMGGSPGLGPNMSPNAGRRVMSPSMVTSPTMRPPGASPLHNSMDGMSSPHSRSHTPSAMSDSIVSAAATTVTTQAITSPVASVAPSSVSMVPPMHVPPSDMVQQPSMPGDDMQRLRKQVADMPPMRPPSHPPTPNMPAPSPGGHSISSYHDEMEGQITNSPTWTPRTPASPKLDKIFKDLENNWQDAPPPPKPVKSSASWKIYGGMSDDQPRGAKSYYRRKRSESLAKLYELGPEAERKPFLDRLFGYMEEIRTPITSCPTINKNQIDLFKLYLAVRERGGFLEVTKSKLWKDIAQVLNVSVSASAAYTVRKHYVKHLLPFSCKFDHGGVDPQTVLAQLESQSSRSKKNQSHHPAPSPAGSSNSQDSFPYGNQSMDGYGPYPPPGTAMDYNQPHMYGQGQPHMSNSMGMPMNAVGNSMMPPGGMGYDRQVMPPYGDRGMPPSNSMGYERNMPGNLSYGRTMHPPPNSMNYPADRMQSMGYPDRGQHMQNSMVQYQQPTGMPYGDVNDMSHMSRTGVPQVPPSSMVNIPPSSMSMSHTAANMANLPSSAMPMPPSSTSMSAQPSIPSSMGGMLPQSPSLPERLPTSVGNIPTTNVSQMVMSPSSLSGTPHSSATNVPSSNTISQSSQQVSAHYPQPNAPQIPPGLEDVPSSQANMSPAPQTESAASAGQNWAMSPNTSTPSAPTNVPGSPRDVSQSQSPVPDNLVPIAGSTPLKESICVQDPFADDPPSMQRFRTPSGASAAIPSLDNGLASSSSINASSAMSSMGPPSMQNRGSFAHSAMGQKTSTTSSYAGDQGGPQAPLTKPSDNYSRDQYGRFINVNKPSSYPSYGNQYDNQRYDNGVPVHNRDYPSSRYPMRPEGYPNYPGSYQSRRDTYGHAKRHPDFEKRAPGDSDTYNRQWQPGMYGKGQSMPRGGWPRDQYGGHPNADYSQDWRQYPPGQGPPGSYMSSFRSSNSQLKAQLSSPAPRDKIGYGMPLKMQPHPANMAAMPPYPRIPREMFPPGTVESVQPVLVKRKRVTSRDLGPVEAWRLMMALKSGQIAESTWALDTLSILLFDDSTVTYFSLHHLPGLVEVLLDHWRAVLIRIFHQFDDLEVGYEKVAKLEKNIVDRKNDDQSKAILKGKNYTTVTRQGRVVKIEPDCGECLTDDLKDWDCWEGFESGKSHWLYGGADTSYHVLSDFYDFDGFMPKRRKVIVKPDKLNTSEETVIVGAEETCASPDPSLERRKCRKVNKSNCADSDSKKSGVKSEVQNCCAKNDEGNKANTNERTKNTVADTSLQNDTIDDVEKLCESPVKNNVKVEGKEETNSFKHKMTEDNGECDEAVTSGLPVQCKKLEDESYRPDLPSLLNVTDGQEHAARRCVCIANIFRSLSFIPDNDTEMSKHPGLLYILGRFLTIHHRHGKRASKQHNFERDEDEELSQYCTSLEPDPEWFWDCLDILREHALVVFSNLAGKLHLMWHPEEIVLPILNGLLHLAVCPSSYSQDPLPQMSANSVLSPQRLALETLSKLSIQERNVDLLLATPPFSRLEDFFGFLSSNLAKTKDQVMREMSVVLLSNLVQSDSPAARAIACQNSTIPSLINFLEEFEVNALQIANSHGINALRDNPEYMGTSLDMLRRTANTLVQLSHIPDNKALFVKHQQRLLHLVMSQILDQQVALLLSDVLYEITHMPT